MINDLRQVDKAFKDKLEGLKIEDKEVPVLYINPEGELKVEEYPAIVIFRSGAYPDNNRWYNDTIKYDWEYYSNGAPKSVKEKPNPLPYNIYYSVRLYYQYQSDGVVMNTHMMRVLDRVAYLPIEGDKYDVQFVSYKNPNATYREFGTVKENKEREFIDQYLYKVEINLETGESTDKTFMKPLEDGGGLVVLHPKIKS